MNLVKASLALALLMTLGMTSNVFAASQSAAAGKKSDPLDTMPKDLTPAEEIQWAQWVKEQRARNERMKESHQKGLQASQKHVEAARGA